MTKYEWETELKKNINRLPKDEQDRAIEYYGELFADKIEMGWSESRIIADFGNPSDVADKILAEYAETWTGETSVETQLSPYNTSAPIYISPASSDAAAMPNKSVQPNNGQSNIQPNAQPNIQPNNGQPNGQPNNNQATPRSWLQRLMSVICAIVGGCLAFAVWVVGLAIVVAGWAMVVAGVITVIVAVIYLGGNTVGAFANIGVGLVVAGIGLLLAGLTLKVVKACIACGKRICGALCGRRTA